MISELFTGIAQAFSKRKRDRLIDLAAAARAIADGNAIDPEEVAVLLEDAGKEPGDLQAMAQRIINRRSLVAKVRAAECVPGRRAELEKKAAAIKARFEAAAKLHDDEMAPIFAASEECDRLEREATAARNALRGDISGDEHAQKRLADIDDKMKSLGAQITLARKQIGDFTREAEVAEASASADKHAERRDEQRAAAASARQTVKDLKGKLDRLDADHNALVAEREEIIEAAAMTAA